LILDAETHKPVCENRRVAEQLSFTEFADFVLARLYELGSSPDGHLHDVREIAGELKAPVPDDWPAEAVSVLESRGYVVGALAFQGAAEASILGEGRLYVEGKAHETKVIDEYRERPSNFVVVSGSGHQVAVGVAGDVTQFRLADDDREELLRLLDEIVSRLEVEPSLAVEERVAYLADIDATRSQIARATPNLKAAASIIEPLGSVAAISELVIAALRLLGVG
jgi:hypothetical protein